MALGNTTKKVIIEAILDDKASKGIKALGKTSVSAGSVIAKSFKAISIAAVAVTVAVGGITVAFIKMSERVGKMQGLAMGFERNFGNMKESLNSFRDASMGMITDMDLMETANRASLLGVTSDIGELSQLMVTARLRGREMGLDMTQAFNDIVTGIGRGSPLILDNLGIKIPDALKESMKSMNEVQKTQALLNFAIKDGQAILEEYGETIELTASEKMAVLKASLTNIADNIKKSFIPAVNAMVFDALSPFLDVIQKLTSEEGLKALWKLLKEGDYTKDFPFAEDGPVVAGIMSVRSAVVLLIDAWKMFNNDFNNIDFGEFEKAVEILTGKGDPETAVEVWNIMLFKIREVRDWLKQLKDTAVNTWNTIKEKVIEVWNVIESFYNETLKPLLDFWWKMIEDTIIPAFEELWAVVKEFFAEFQGDGEKNKEMLKAMAEIIGIMIIGAVTLVIAAFWLLIKVVTGLITIMKGFKKKSDEAWDSLVEKMTNVILKFRSIRDWVQKVIDKIKQIPASLGINFRGEDLNQISGGISRGGMTLVGEAGPEIVSLPQGSHVYNNADSQKMGGGNEVSITNNIYNQNIDENLLSGRMAFQLSTL